MQNRKRSKTTINNYRRILKGAIRNAQKTFPTANMDHNVSDWFARNRFTENYLAMFGLKGDFFTTSNMLNARNEKGKEIPHRILRRLGRAAMRQGMLVDLEKLTDFWIVGADVRMMKFVKGIVKPPIFNVNKAIQFHKN